MKSRFTILEIMEEHKHEYYKAIIAQKNKYEMFIPGFFFELFCYGVLINTDNQFRKITKRRIDQSKYCYNGSINIFNSSSHFKFLWKIMKEIEIGKYKEIKDIDKVFNIHERVKKIDSAKFDKHGFNKSIKLDDYKSEKRQLLFSAR